MISRILITGGGGKFLRLYFVLPILFFSVVAAAEQPPYRGVVNYYNVYVNQFFTLDSSGNITLGDLFGEGEWRFWIDPTGHILLGYDNDFSTTKSLKWYRIEGESFVESPQQLPSANHIPPVAWTATQFRAIVGSQPLRVWSLNPVSLEATLISEFSDPDAPSYFATIVPDLSFLYLGTANYKITRVLYNDATGIVSGPVTIFPTPHMGNVDLVQTSDGRLIVQLSSSDYLTIFHVEDDGSLTITQDVQLHLFDIQNIHGAMISPDDRFLFVIARDGNNVNSFDLSSSGTITAITRLSGFDLAQALALTPDGKFLVVAHHYYGGYPAAILSVFEVGEDGSLTYLSGKDIPLSNTVAELAFFPPPTELSTAAKNWMLYW